MPCILSAELSKIDAAGYELNVLNGISGILSGSDLKVVLVKILAISRQNSNSHFTSRNGLKSSLGIYTKLLLASGFLSLVKIKEPRRKLSAMMVNVGLDRPNRGKTDEPTT